ncbi:hypothetical protein QBC47DRAFT_92957 [Echria macrotheca]|uniref:Uncharacterized protein n=1 Tax=Echria macrotheca TaxID=438768 RepID=A0AAJ0B355_9PEZI|nr:hypothetical protein QBC47DRAFT_92957 [Echria macrotheca]
MCPALPAVEFWMPFCTVCTSMDMWCANGNGCWFTRDFYFFWFGWFDIFLIGKGLVVWWYGGRFSLSFFFLSLSLCLLAALNGKIYIESGNTV